MVMGVSVREGSERGEPMLWEGVISPPEDRRREEGIAVRTGTIMVWV